MPPKRVSRRTGNADSIRRLDEKGRRNLTLTYIASIEKDCMEEDNFERVDDDELVTSVVGGQKKRKKRTRQEILSKTNEKRTLEQIIKQEMSKTTPNYLSIDVEKYHPSTRNSCDVCGITGIYNCIRCGLRICNMRCMTLHTENKCVKR